MDRHDDDQPALDHLDVDECYDLLDRCTVGRVAVNVANLGPLVVPVNYAMDGDVVVFRTDDGTKLLVLRNGPISFQIDSFDHARRTGWSVLVRGVAYVAADWEVRDVDVQPWAGGEKASWVRLVPATVTGRRVALSSLPADERGYR